jgi:hypothetical protein
MQARIQLVSIVGAAILLLAVLEMVRRRRLMERYALLWLLSAGVLLALAIWSDALARISHAIGVIYPPNALFFIAIGCIVLLLLHFSSVLSRLTDQSDMLAQRHALLEERLRSQEQLAEDRALAATRDAVDDPQGDPVLGRQSSDCRASSTRAGNGRQPHHQR